MFFTSRSSPTLLFALTFVWGLQAALGGVLHSKCPTDVEGISFGSCRTLRVQSRLPPMINPNPKEFESWKPPPAGWTYGNWKITHSSSQLYLTSFRNMQGDSAPVFPANASLPGQTNDVSSFQPPTSSMIITSYGISTPLRSLDKTLGSEWDAAFHFQGVGAMASTNNSWAILSWGYDKCGIPYFVAWESEIVTVAQPPALDIHVRSDEGPTAETMEEIIASLKALGNEAITDLAERTVPLVQDGERRGLPPVVCDAACQNNTVYSS